MRTIDDLWRNYKALMACIEDNKVTGKPLTPGQALKIYGIAPRPKGRGDTIMKIVIVDRGCLPIRAYQYDAGWDLRTREKIKIHPGETIKIPTGVKVEIPKGYMGFIKERSGGMPDELLVREGTIDSGFRGELKIKITNLSRINTYDILPYTRAAQLVICKIMSNNYLEEVDTLPISERGERGFGSSGIY